MHGVTLRQLEAFVAIVQGGTLSAAAEQLCLSKAAVSMSLNELEKQLDCRLFERVRNRLQVNDQGRHLLPLADDVLHRMQDIQTLFASTAQVQGTLRVGASASIGNYLLPELIAGYRQHYPAVKLEATISNTRSLGQMLGGFALDIALVEGQLSSPDLVCHDWQGDRLLVIAAPDHPLSGEAGLCLGDLEDQGWLLREQGSGSREQFHRLLGDQLLAWHSVLELNTTEALVNAVACGLGLCLISGLAAERALADGRVRALDVDPPLLRRLKWVVHREKYQHPALASFIRYCAQWRRPVSRPVVVAE